ncbi:DUF5677 domain-containing protein [Paenibacillus gyeongsangnamensis]|uniref:DUF5677 domain-containing protein n=1 Tax=Paenibacillus gyeongsangnamensis TaxID=3388067 RepID=UPI003907FA37
MRKLLAQFDGIFILLDHGSLNSAAITTRSALETFASLMFIFEDGIEFVEKRAASYYTFYKLEELKHLNNPIIADRISSSYSVAKLQEMKNSIKTKLNKQSLYKEVSEMRFELIKNLRNAKRKESVHWYSLYTKNNIEIFSLSALIVYVDRFGNDLNKLYSLLSFETHSLNANSDLDFQKNQVIFDDLRHEKNIETYDLFRQVRDFLAFPTFHIISRYLTKDEVVNLENSMREIALVLRNSSQKHNQTVHSIKCLFIQLNGYDSVIMQTAAAVCFVVEQTGSYLHMCGNCRGKEYLYNDCNLNSYFT